MTTALRTPVRRLRRRAGQVLGGEQRHGWRFVARRVARVRWRSRAGRRLASASGPAPVAVAVVETGAIDPARVTVTTVHPAERFVLAAAGDLDPWLVEAPGWHTEHEVPAQAVVTLRDGWVLGAGGDVGPDPHTVCIDLDRGIHREPADIARSVAEARGRGVEVLTGTTVSGLVLGGDNYFHWMTQGLARLAMTLAAVDPAGVDRVLVPAGPGFVAETVARIGVPDAKVVRVGDDAGAFRAERLVAGSTPWSWNPTPGWAVETVRAAFAAERAAAGSGDRLYLRRLGAGQARRRVVNDDAVEAVLTGFGFRTVATEGLTVAEQAALFAGAEIVVGLHGAGLANLMFCRPGTQVVELLPANAAVATYHLLARQAGLHHHPLVGTEARPPRRWRMYCTDADTVADVAALRRLVGRLVADVAPPR